MQNISDLPWLTILIVVPLVAAAVIWLVPGVQRAARTIGLAVSLVVLVGFVVMASGFDLGLAGDYQFVEQASWIPQLGVSYALGVNGLGLTLVRRVCDATGSTITLASNLGVGTTFTVRVPME